MNSESVFPHIQKKHLPEVFTKIFLFVNYGDSISTFRLVSKGWNAFIKREMLSKSSIKSILMGKQFVHEWTRKPPLRQSFPEVSYTVDDIKVTGEYITINSRSYNNIKFTWIYKNNDYVGYIIKKEELYESLVCPRFVACNDFFIDVHDYYLPTPWLQLKAYKRQDYKSMELQPFTLHSAVSLVGRMMLHLVSVDENTLLLICKEEATSNLVLINLVDDTERVVILSSANWSSYLKVSTGSQEMTIMDVRHAEGKWFLHMVDLQKGEERWLFRGKNYYCNSTGISLSPCTTLKSLSVTCVHFDWAREHAIEQVSWSKFFHIFDNMTGQLINCFSTAFRTLYRDHIFSLAVAGFSAVFFMPHSLTVRIFDAQKGRASEVKLSMPHLTSCSDQGRISNIKFVGVFRKRVFLAQLCCWTCYSTSLVAFDLLSAEKKPVTLDSHGHCEYVLDGARERVLRTSSFQILDFSKPSVLCVINMDLRLLAA